MGVPPTMSSLGSGSGRSNGNRNREKYAQFRKIIWTNIKGDWLNIDWLFTFVGYHIRHQKERTLYQEKVQFSERKQHLHPIFDILLVYGSGKWSIFDDLVP